MNTQLGVVEHPGEQQPGPGRGVMVIMQILLTPAGGLHVSLRDNLPVDAPNCPTGTPSTLSASTTHCYTPYLAPCVHS